jgi:hypothetical protein
MTRGSVSARASGEIEPNREVWAVYRQGEVMVIRITDWAYSRLILATRDPHVDASLLQPNP